MSVLTVAALKALWVNGFIPDQDDYVDLFDTIEALGLADAIAASNGLSRNGNDLKLGGSDLSEQTLIRHAGFDFHLGAWFDEEGSVQLSEGLTMLANGTNYEWKNNANAFIQMLSNYLRVGTFKNGGGATLEFIGAQNNAKAILRGFAGINFETSYLGDDEGYTFKSNQNSAKIELSFRGIDADRVMQFLNVSGDVPVRVAVPATATSTGVAGSIAWDASHFYVCTATNTWVRTALATW